MIHLPNDFKEFLQLLNAKKIEYLVVGGYAVALYGYPRATGDIDIWIAISSDTAQRMFDALQDFGFSVPELKKELFLEPGRNIRMGNPPLRIEVLTSIDGVVFSDCFRDRNTVVLENIPVHFISLSDLKKNKLASGRLQDRADVEHLG